MSGLARILTVGVLVAVAWAGGACAQQVRALKLIDAPTAESMERGVYDLNLVFYPEGGLLFGARLGLAPRLAVGFNYGGLGIVGQGTPDWNPRVEFNARYQIIPESFSFPAIALGFDSQGYGSYDDEKDRYQVKSKGFYAVASRNYAFWGRTAFHGGVNLSLEGKADPQKDNPNVFLGLEKSVGPDVTLLVEYDAALNDGGDWDTRGRLNVAAMWTYAERLRLQLDARNLLRSKEGHQVGDERQIADEWSRGLQISYREQF